MVYLDYAATAPMVAPALAAYVEAAGAFGNPSSAHAAGRRARVLVEEARESIAAALGARPFEIIFTSGGTESDNLAVKGLYWARNGLDQRRNKIVITPIEHHAVLDAVAWLARHESAEAIRLPVGAAGIVSPADLSEVLESTGPHVAVVTAMLANNEVGTLQPVSQLAEVAAAHGVPLHTDAVQAVGQIPVDFAAIGATAMSVSAHKLGGPPGVGALILRRDVACTPLFHGGGQEREIRSGTLDVPGIVAFAAAVRAAVSGRDEHATRMARLRDELIERVLAAVPEAVLNGDHGERLPGNAHFSFPGCEGDSLLLLLDARGIACSTGSACAAGAAQPSHVLIAMGADPTTARSSLRFTLGSASTRADVDALVGALPAVVERARRASGQVSAGQVSAGPQQVGPLPGGRLPSIP